jgi:hypothetical protein
MGFGRLRFIVENILPNTSYTITHPYGVNTFTSEADPKNPAVGRIRVTIDSGVCAPSLTTPCDWAGVGAAFLGDYKAGSTATFLRQVGAAPGTLGDINTPRAVTGAPSGTNAVIITGPNAGGPGVNTLTVNTFTVQGLIAEGTDGAPSTPDLAAASDSGRSATDNITNVTAPTLTGTVPAGSTAPVQLIVDGAATPVTATSSEFVQGVSGSTFTLKNAAGTTIPATVTYDQAARRATLDPTALLTPSTTYTATLTGGTATIRDLANRPLASTSWRFTTSAAPTVTSRTPGINATGVLRTVNVTATFSKPVNGVSTATFTLKNATTGAAIAATVTRNGTTNQWILNPAATLAASTRYTATITGGPTAVRDVAGTPLASTAWNFTTGTR